MSGQVTEAVSPALISLGCYICWIYSSLGEYSVRLIKLPGAAEIFLKAFFIMLFLSLVIMKREIKSSSGPKLIGTAFVVSNVMGVIALLIGYISAPGGGIRLYNSYQLTSVMVFVGTQLTLSFASMVWICGVGGVLVLKFIPRLKTF